MRLQEMLRVLTAAAVGLAVIGCQESPMESTGGGVPLASTREVNLLCPMTGSVVAPSVPTRSFEGRTVGFACVMCPGRWDQLSSDAKRARLAAALADQKSMVINTRCPITGNPVNVQAAMRAYMGNIVGFCDPTCGETWDRLPDDQKQARLGAAMKK
ncbi:MAG: hypothetical protein NTV86_08375 [Planctomycetota bacterium]|nr:hypothetical protein [Planctomycetota bacterium]